MPSPTPIEPGVKDYHKALQLYRIMKTAERRMNDASIGGTKRKKAEHRCKEYRNILLARGYCISTPPK